MAEERASSGDGKGSRMKSVPPSTRRRDGNDASGGGADSERHPRHERRRSTSSDAGRMLETELADPWEGVDGKDARSAFPKFRRQLERLYPGALPYDEAAASIVQLLEKHGFRAGNSVAMVSQCRDDETKAMAQALDALFCGRSLNISSLAGTVFCGKAGLRAGMCNAPVDEDGWARYVLFAGPHIALSQDGEFGSVPRPGQDKRAVCACGTLQGFAKELRAGKLDLTADPVDLELHHLKQLLLQGVHVGLPAPDLHQLTMIAHQVTVDSVRKTVAAAVDGGKGLTAIVTGVLIHGPNDTHYFWPGTLETTQPAKKGSALAKKGEPLVVDALPELKQQSREEYTAKFHQLLAARAHQQAVCVSCDADGEASRRSRPSPSKARSGKTRA